MSTSETITKTDLKNILEAAGNIGSVDSTPTPTASKVSEFDAAAQMNSTDMTSQEVTSFVEDLNIEGGGSGTSTPTANTAAKFDANAHMNSADMTTQEVNTLVAELDIAGEHDSGWRTAQVASDFQLYASNSTIRYRKIGYMVDIHGIVTPAATITGSDTNYTIFTLPEHYRPQYARTYIMQGSGNSIWQLRILANGNVAFSRYRNAALTTATAYSDATNGTWLPFNAIFTVDDSVV